MDKGKSPYVINITRNIEHIPRLLLSDFDHNAHDLASFRTYPHFLEI